MLLTASLPGCAYAVYPHFISHFPFGGWAEAAIAFTSQEEVVFNVLHELVGQAEWLRNYVVLFCRLQVLASKNVQQK